MNKVNVIVVDDEKLIREGLKIILSTYEDIEVVGVASDGREALNLCKEEEIQVVLMDIRMPNCDGVLGTRIIKEQFPDIKILILTTFNDKEYIHEALKFGASGYLLKDSSNDLIYEGIKACIKGNIVVHPDVANNIILNTNYGKEVNQDDISLKYNLTERELNIIREIAKGLSNKEIAEKIYLSEGTVKNNISTILSKLDLRDRTQIAIFAFKNNIVN
ncbi:response regulator transcription factor [Clostridium sporogenes]|uniref:response regulator transcription factor n=1 Tax=unclassified Clostridium TaxID=2614128 RepID=UPI0013D69258|nr:response regulator transcription factor [Clostridium sporogenes]NFS27024.1 response regulator transcription factor [Clostridium sporogenes]